MRARLNQQETEARVRTDAILEQLVNACRQVGLSITRLVGNNRVYRWYGCWLVIS